MKSENILTLEECMDRIAQRAVKYELLRHPVYYQSWDDLIKQPTERLELLLTKAAELCISQFKNQLEEKNKEVERLKAENNRFNKELDIVHRCLTELCDIDTIYPVIRRCLDEIELLNP